MSHRPRPLLLGYIRASVFGRAADLHRAEAALAAFVAREEFSLGPVFVEKDGVTGAFHALLDELVRNEAARGVLIPDLRHLSCDEQLILSRHEQGARTPVVVVDFAPSAGGPGADSPVCTGSFAPSPVRTEPPSDRSGPVA
jgi:hypothetical protein